MSIHKCYDEECSVVINASNLWCDKHWAAYLRRELDTYKEKLKLYEAHPYSAHDFTTMVAQLTGYRRSLAAGAQSYTDLLARFDALQTQYNQSRDEVDLLLSVVTLATGGRAVTSRPGFEGLNTMVEAEFGTRLRIALDHIKEHGLDLVRSVVSKHGMGYSEELASFLGRVCEKDGCTNKAPLGYGRQCVEHGGSVDCCISGCMFLVKPPLLQCHNHEVTYTPDGTLNVDDL